MSANVLCIEGSLGWEQLHPLEGMAGLNFHSLLPVLLSLFLWQLQQQLWQPGCDLWALLGEQGTLLGHNPVLAAGDGSSQAAAVVELGLC